LHAHVLRKAANSLVARDLTLALMRDASRQPLLYSPSVYRHCGYKSFVVAQPDSESLLPLPSATSHILMALASAGRHGYAIIQDVASRTNNSPKLGAGTLYRSVQRMVEQGVSLKPAIGLMMLTGTMSAAATTASHVGAKVARAEANR
jgi:hypothetical protein